MKDEYLFIIWLLFFALFLSDLNNYLLKQELKTCNMLSGFDQELLEDRENLLNANGIKFNDYIFIEKENKWVKKLV